MATTAEEDVMLPYEQPPDGYDAWTENIWIVRLDDGHWRGCLWHPLAGVTPRESQPPQCGENGCEHPAMRVIIGGATPPKPKPRERPIR